MGGGNFGSAGMSRFTQSQNYHADQYGYFTGYPYAIINVIANRLASQPIRVARKIPAGRKPAPGRAIKQAGDGTPLLPKSFHDISDQLEILPDHRLLRAIANPNPIMIRHHLLYATFASLEITGRGYWWMYTDPETKKDQIWPLPTHWVEPYHDPETDQLYAFYRVTLPGTGQQVKVPRRQIVPFMMSDPSDPFSALSPMTAMARTVMTDFAFETAQRMSLENGVNPGLAIMVGKPPDFAGVGGDQMVLTADQRAQIVAAVKRQYRGVTRFDEPLILDALIKDVKPITTSPREMAFKDSGPLVRNRMTQGWGMNPITLGEIEGVNYASSGVADHHVCFVAGTGVITSNGVKNIEDICIGDAVLTHTGKWKKVTNTIQRNYSGNIVNAHISGAVVNVRMTEEHPIGTVNGWMPANICDGQTALLSKPQTVSDLVVVQDWVKDLTGEHGPRKKSDGTRVKLRKNGVYATLPKEFVVSSEMAFFFGLYLAEGHCDTNNGVQWSLHKKESGYAERIQVAFGGLTRSEVKIHRRTSAPNSIQISLRNATFAELVQNLFGAGSRYKRVPSIVFGWSEELRMQFLKGYLAGDGHVNEKEVAYGTVSRSIGYGIRLLARSLGLNAYVLEVDQPEIATIQGRIVNQAPIRYQGRFYAESRCKLTGQIPVHVHYDKDPVISVQDPEFFEGTVYNLSVEEDESYTLENGWAVHNCRTVFGPRTESNSQTLTCYVPHYLPDRSLNVPDGEIIVYQEPVQPTDPEMEMTRDWGDYDRAILSQNELRRKRGLPPLVDGDRALTPTGWVPVQTEEQAREQSTPGGAKSFVMDSKVRDDSGHEHDTDGCFGSGGGGNSGESKPATKPKDEYKPGTAAHGNNGSVNDSDHEQAKRAAGFMGKLKKLGKKAVTVAKIAAVAAKHCIDEGNEFLIKTRLADDIIDNANDWGMITNSHMVKEQLGMGGQMAAKAVSVVAGYAFTKLRQYVHAKRAKKGFTLNSLKDGKKETIGDVAKKVHSVLVAVMGPKGAGAAIDELPTVKMIAAKLASTHDDNKRAEIKKKSGRVIQQVRSAALVVDNRRKLEEQKVAALLAPVFHHLGQKAAMVLREELRKSPHHQVDELVHRVIDRKLWEDALTPAVTEALKAAVMGGSLAEWGLYLQHRQNVQKSGEERKTLPRRFLDAAQKVADEIIEKGFISTIVSGVMNLVGRFFTRGKEKGLVGPELADFVAGKSLVGSAAEKAADEIARNDGGAAVNEGRSVVRMELAKSGEIAGVRWVSMHDGRVRPTHQKADGQTIQPHGFFTVGGHQCKHPGDSSLPMDERAGCRCQAVTIYKE